MKSPIAQLLSCFLLLCLCGIPEPLSADSRACRIEAFLVQIPNEGCPMERYPIVFKPAQPHLSFVQDLRVELLSSQFSFEVRRGESEYSFELKPGKYRFKITASSSPNCSTIQDVMVRKPTSHSLLRAVCKDVNIQLQKGGVFLSPSDIAGESFSSCSPISFELDQYFFSTADIGPHQVKVSLTDAQNRRQSCYSTVKVLPQLHSSPSLQHQTPIWKFEQCVESKSLARNSLAPDGTLTMVSVGQLARTPLNIVSQARFGDGEIKVQLSNLQVEGQSKGRAGLIIKESCHPLAPYLSILLEANTGNIHKEFRLTTAGEVVKEWEHRLHPPTWLKLKRKGGHFKAFTSHNGLHWQLVYSTSMQIGSILHWGLLTENINPDSHTIATFNHLSITTEANTPYLATPPKLNSEADSDTVLPDTYNKSKPKTIMEQEQWSIFPNPAQDYLEVTLPIWKDDRATLHLLNSAGKAVLEEQLDVLNGQSHWMNLAKVARGVYYLKLQTIEGQHLTKKVIVDK